MSDNVTALAVVPAPDAASLNAQDQTFLQQAQLSNLTEIAEANAALKNTSSITSREFARWMIGDHGGMTGAWDIEVRQKEMDAVGIAGEVIFPDADAAAAAPTAPLQEVREAALILLYRLLFILYAEDRDLLPVRGAAAHL